MNTRAFTLALIIAVFSIILVNTYIDDQQASLQQKYGNPSAVVVAKVDIDELELIDDSKVTITTIPKTFVQPGAFNRVEDVLNTVAATPIKKGEQLSKPRVHLPGMKTGLARQVNPGKRAIAVAINEEQAVGKLIRPGDRVDVIAPIDYAGGRKDLQSVKTILQDVYVLSTGLSMTSDIPIVGVKTDKAIKALKLNTYARYNTVTLELDPYQVQKLVYLSRFTPEKPYLVLRNNSDKEIVRMKPTGIFDVLDTEANDAKRFFLEKYQNQGAGGAKRGP